MLTPLRGLLGRPPSALELVHRILQEIDRRWPAGADQPVELAPLHAEVLAAVFHCGPATGPLSLGKDQPSRRAVAADAYFAPAVWWPEPSPAAGVDAHARAVERRLQARYALVYAVLESALRERPPADLAARLEARIAQMLGDPYYDGRSPWQRPDRPSLETCLTWLAALPGDEAVTTIARLVAGSYDSGPHLPPGAAGEGERSYAIYAKPLLTALPRLLERLWAAGQLDEALLDRVQRRFPGFLDEITAPPEENTALHAVSPAFAAVLRAWAGGVARALAADLLPLTLPVLKQVRCVTGVWSLETVARRLREWQLDHLPVAGYGRSAELTSGLVHLLRIARPDPDEETGRVIARLRALGETALLTMLPLATGFREPLLAALDWPGAAALVELIEHLAGLDAGVRERNGRLRYGPAPGVLDAPALAALGERLGPDRLARVLATYEYHVPAAGEALLLIRAALGLNADQVHEGVLKRRPAALAALGLLPLATPSDLAERAGLLARVAEGSPATSPERRRQEVAAAQAGLANLAISAGLPDLIRLEWAVEDEQAAALPAIGQTWTVDGRHTLRLALAGCRPVLLVARDGQTLRETPAEVRASPAFAEARGHLLTLRRLAERDGERLARLMSDGTPLQLEDLARLARHPVAGELLRRLVVIDETGQTGLCLPDDRALVTLAGEPAPVAGPVRLAHPLDLVGAGVLAEWQRLIVARGIVQPFHQVFREFYLPLPAAALAPGPDGAPPLSDTAAASRFAGHQVEAAVALPLLQSAGWTVEAGHWPFRDVPSADLRIVLAIDDGDPAAADGVLTLGPLLFLPLARRGGGPELASDAPLPLAAVPAILLSEALRLADLMTAQARPARQLAPRPLSAAVMGRRADLIRALAGAMGLANVRVAGELVLIVGRHGTYRVHLGSARVLLEPGRLVGRLPAVERAAPPYLPTAVEDRRTAELVATVLLLAADEEITDARTLALIRGDGAADRGPRG
jgi:hypothetical protein